MKRIQIAAFTLTLGTTFSALAQTVAGEIDCFPACQPAAVATEIKTESAKPCGQPSAAQELAASAEKLNDQIKPVKEIAGYVRSPQGLAMKLVNDHVLKIPAWVGYAVDPVGSIKNKAMDEVRTRAKSAIGLTKPEACPVTETPIDPALIPIDTNQV
jgi:hypothetical protein